eukprot:360901-Rhodomonas_salina.3
MAWNAASSMTTSSSAPCDDAPQLMQRWVLKSMGHTSTHDDDDPQSQGHQLINGWSSVDEQSMGQQLMQHRSS